MGALLQLMTLPAACMLLAWMRGRSAQAVAALLRGAIAMLARAAHPRTLPPGFAIAGAPGRARRLRRYSGLRAA